MQTVRQTTILLTLKCCIAARPTSSRRSTKGRPGAVECSPSPHLRHLRSPQSIALPYPWASHHQTLPRPPRPADLWRPPILAHSGTQDYASLGNAERLDRRHVLRQSPVRREAKFRAAHPSRPDVGKSAEKANASGGEVAALRARNYMYETRFRRYLNTRHAPSSRAPSSRASSFRFTARCTLSFHSSRRLCISSNCSFDCSWVGDR